LLRGFVKVDMKTNSTYNVSVDKTQKDLEKQNNEIKEKKSKKKKTAASFAAEFFIKLGITSFIVFSLLLFVVGVYVNHSNSSYPMLKDGDLCLTYKLAKQRNGDEIAYQYDGKIRFGRIVAIPGDIVDINEGNITVNGYGVYDKAVYATPAEGSAITYPYTVQPDTVFVLNDYREDITDSRTYGSIALSDIKGKVIMVMRLRGI
jgi:signal peptidase I